MSSLKVGVFCALGLGLCVLCGPSSQIRLYAVSWCATTVGVICGIGVPAAGAGAFYVFYFKPTDW